MTRPQPNPYSISAGWLDAVRLHAGDLSTGAVLFCIAFAAVMITHGQLDLSLAAKAGVWFSADVHTALLNMTQADSNFANLRLNPLLPLVSHPVLEILTRVGISKTAGLSLYLSASAGLLMVLFFSLLRVCGNSRLQAVLFSLLLSVSSAWLFWTAVPGPYPLAAAGLLALLIVTAKATRATPGWLRVLASTAAVGTLAVSAVPALLAAWRHKSLLRSAGIVLLAAGLICIAWVVAHALYPTTQFFLSLPWPPGELLSQVGNAISGLADAVRVFVLHSVVTPQVDVLAPAADPRWPLLSVQQAALGSSGIAGWAASLLWLGLLALGFYRAAGHWRRRAAEGRAKFPFSWLLIITGLFYLLFFQSQAQPLFQHSLMWVPVLILLAAGAARDMQGWWINVALVLLVAATAFNNLQQLQAAGNELGKQEYRQHLTEREKLTDAMAAYPQADWPRQAGHVVLAATGSPLANKGYHEPGGSFSPGFGTVGISLVQLDKSSSEVSSSNNIPASDIRQFLSGAGIVTETPLYRAEWTSSGAARWNLRYQVDPGNLRHAIRITSSGPAGGPVERTRWDGRQLTVNGNVVIRFDTAPAEALLGDERQPLAAQFSSTPLPAEYTPADTFFSALFVLPEGAEHTVSAALTGTEPSTLPAYPAQPPLLSLPDSRFADSMAAQIFHTRAGVVGTDLRPGDPGNYDINWLRDGAYSLAALARAGELPLARALGRVYAEQDFFGGFGAEADAPGLAIWALDEIAARVNNRAYDQALWPHIQRKVALIETLLSATSTVSRPFYGAIVPAHRDKTFEALSVIARPASNGLINGKMDNHYPLFYVNATAYLGLHRAADFARRLQHQDLARRYRRQAADLRAAWQTALPSHNARYNQRTIISGLWPSGIARGAEEIYSGLLQGSWHNRRHDNGAFKSLPLWPYFDVGEAHQWLMLGDVQRTWLNLEWFWANQVSEGLYTWWEGNGEENTFGLWNHVRGWTDPPHVTPHYWVAAEMYLLQANMLVLERHDNNTVNVILGAGIPAGWLHQPFAVENVLLRSGRLSWRWDGSRINVDFTPAADAEVRFVPGPGFPDDVVIERRASGS